jgi:probable HAF family extracellular repeat protein
MSTAHRLASSHSVASPVVAPKRRRSSAVHAITAAVEPLERRLCLSAATLTPLGELPGGSFSSAPTGISADGSVIVGGSSSASGQQAFRWTSDGGMVGLGNLPGGLWSQAYGVSADGSVIVGYDSTKAGDKAFRWTAAGGMQPLGDLSGATGGWANSASGAGSVIVGQSFSEFHIEAFRWTGGGGMVGLGYLPGGGLESWATRVSADGSVIVGSSDRGPAAGYYEAFRWTAAGGMQGLGDLPGGEFSSGARGVSADGSVIVGAGSTASGIEAFRWTSDGGMVGLGQLPGGVGSEAIGVSGDGSVVVGVSNFNPGFRAFYWTADGGVRDLWNLLLSQGVDPAVDGWTQLYSAQGISADGSTIIGTGIRNNNTEAFVATLVAPDIVTSAFQFNDLPHRIVTTFDQNVSGSLGIDDLLIENLTTQQTIPSSDFALAYDTATNTATFSYTGNASGINGVLPDGNYRATLLAAGITNASGTPMPGDVTLDFFFLNGDANRDGAVNLADFNVLAANFGQSNRTFSQGDFNYDGIVNLQDFNLLASRFGVSVAPAGTGSIFEDDGLPDEDAAVDLLSGIA